MTGKQASQINQNGPGGMPQINEFLVTASARDIQEYIHNISVGPTDHLYQRARTALEVRISEDHLRAAEKMERQTDKIIRLTWGLFWLTLILSFVAAIQLYIMLK